MRKLLPEVKEYFAAPPRKDMCDLPYESTQLLLRLVALGYLPPQRSLMFFSPVIAPWIDLSIKAGHLAFETQAWVGSRLFRMSSGTVPLIAETHRVIPEKVAALTAQALIAEGGGSVRTPRKMAARGRVKANKDRLSKSPRISRR